MLSDQDTGWVRARNEDPAIPAGGGIMVRRQGDKILMGNPNSGPIMTYTRAEWEAFLAGVKEGDFEGLEL